ncbi:putative catalyzes the formation of phosphatidylethanolamine (PtdEtn) from phosphatidylserine (PtdSer) [Lyophyllum shimeji]|uniref:Catalyzes the formation of phosphatidylethanolamine (PtdEtn) from phosphatidylserine (PtdSer) n=1 Tax=Lyophyllum shimeji TaxID=47721 RepID=A0A9P3Q370_LYOSH|nr:putative catalyzes the formation of phosphatidylethanolamine (PtdEtn) from phosphatidylserine (PtdSer) [Lyophyllum shimeji]
MIRDGFPPCSPPRTATNCRASTAALRAPPTLISTHGGVALLVLRILPPPTSAAPASAEPPSSSSFPKKRFPLPIPVPRLSGLTSSSSSSSQSSPVSSSNLGTPSPALPPPAAVVDPVSGALVPGTPASAPEVEAVQTPGKKGRLFRKRWGALSTPTTLDAEIVEPVTTVDGVTRTGRDTDPFVVISFGKKVFRTRAIRHSLNPTFEEKLRFHVSWYETPFSVQLAVHDWDKLSSNDHIGDASFEVRELIDKAPQMNQKRGFKLDGSKDAHGPWEGGKYNPIIHVRPKYQPYDLLRRPFWRQYLRQYDMDDTGAISHLELTSMLNSLGSTLTVNAFFMTHGKGPHYDELSIEEAIACLETELGRPDGERRRVEGDNVAGMGKLVSWGRRCCCCLVEGRTRGWILVRWISGARRM